jgi:hypothetical protein
MKVQRVGLSLNGFEPHVYIQVSAGCGTSVIFVQQVISDMASIKPII